MRFVTLALPLLLPTAALATNVTSENISEILKLTEVQEHRHSDGIPDITGTLPSGTRIEIDFDRNGAVDDIEARDHALFPASEIAGMLPEAVALSGSWPTDAMLSSLDFDSRGHIEIEGQQSDGTWFEAEFTRTGKLADYDIDD